MTGAEIKEARETLGLTLVEFGHLLGFSGAHLRQQMHRLETGERPIREPQRRLIVAYLEGYRPKDWPQREP